MIDQQDLRRWVLANVRPAILEIYKPNSCIATVKVLCEVLTHFGVPARPAPCGLRVANEAGEPLLRGTDDLTAEQIEAFRQAGAWMCEVVGSGMIAPEDNRWDDHLVTIADFDDGRWLLDLAIDQASRPKRGIHMPPIASRLPDDGFTAPHGLRTPGGSVLWIPLRDTNWRNCIDWRSKDITRPLAGSLIRQYRSTIKEDAHA